MGFAFSYEDLLALDDTNAVKVGLNKSQLARLPSTTFRRGQKTEDEAKCDICLELPEENQQVIILPACLHTFHSECILKWLKDHKTCPVWFVLTVCTRPLLL
jgi:hypothetical protein